MASSSSVETSGILWKFGSIHLTELDFGYVDRHFAVAFEKELGPTWTLMDNNGHTHVVEYNMNTMNPRITTGWCEMRTLYPQKLNNAHINFEYVGNNCFHITTYFGACSEQNRESFIYDSTHYPDTSLFPIKLTRSQSQGSHLDLHSAFGNFIRSKGYTEVMILGYKDGIMCKVVVSQTRNSTKFGKGWREFCMEYGLKEGDVLVFEANNQGNDILLEVYINGCPCNVIHPISL